MNVPARHPVVMRLIVVAGLAGACWLAIAASQAGAPDSPRPVLLPVRVVDRAGHHVPDLAPDDFEVTVDNRPVPVAAAVRVDASPPPVASPSMRRVVFAVNRPAMPSGAGARTLEAAAAFVDRRPGYELAAVWPIPSSEFPLDLHRDRAATRTALLEARGTGAVETGLHVVTLAEAARIAAGDGTVLERILNRECASPPVAGARPSSSDVAPGAPPARPASPAAPVVTTAGEVTLKGISLGRLLAAAADYARRFEESMTTVVIEERYVQAVKRWATPPSAPDEARLGWRDGKDANRLDIVMLERRQTRSDLLLVQIPDQTWTAYRDVLEIDGRAAGRREDRLKTLFLEGTPDSRKQLRRINEASAEWNLGRFYREINLPTLPLTVLLPRNQAGFSFGVGEIERVAETPCHLVSFLEVRRPTLVQTLHGVDVPLRGSVCLDAGGRVWQTRIDLDERFTARGVMVVTYASNERLDVLVPARMWEWYLPRKMLQPTGAGTWISPGPVYIEALATYSNMRRFTVETTETVVP